MSISLMKEVWSSSLPLLDKAVALAMADHANDDGLSIYPSQDKLARKVGCNDRSVRRAIRRLKAMGILVEIGETKWQTKEYRMIAENLPK